jgi:hypothetical protein
MSRSKPRFKVRKMGEAPLRDYVVRFVFGGAVAAVAAAVGKIWGPSVGGLFLAFPALLPASLTLVDEEDGRASAVDDARGAVLGSIGLGAFAAVVALLSKSVPPIVVLALALAAWGAVSMGLWWQRLRTARKTSRSPSPQRTGSCGRP